MPSQIKSGIQFSALGLRAKSPTIERLMTAALDNPKLLSLAAGFTDNASLPHNVVRSAVNELTRRESKETLQYGLNQGRPLLRKQLAVHLATWEPQLMDAAADTRFFVTNGSQQALYLAMQVLCEPGDIVLVDRPSYFVFLEMLVAMGVRAISMPVDEHGRLNQSALKQRLTELELSGDRQRIKVVYFVSYYSNPSSRSLDEVEKRELAVTLTGQGLVIPVIEDAAYRDLYFSERSATPSTLTLSEWADFPKLYLSTLTKPFATGLKVGYGYCTEPDWLARMLHTKGHHDFGSANFNQAIIERVITDGGFERQLGDIRPIYLRKMLALHETLIAEGLRELGWTWSKPEGGLYLWLEAPENLDTGLATAFCRKCIDAGVLYVPGELCFGDEAPANFIRMSFGVLGETDLREAARRFVKVARSYSV
jgi:2-aminoadipate transaminase|uniref:aminotransferase-like domain-containing protein n=1 Tax=Cephaloticoccus sp. TaxID=1985742 RepID=UPI004048F9BD